MSQQNDPCKLCGTVLNQKPPMSDLSGRLVQVVICTVCGEYCYDDSIECWLHDNPKKVWSLSVATRNSASCLELTGRSAEELASRYLDMTVPQKLQATLEFIAKQSARFGADVAICHSDWPLCLASSTEETSALCIALCEQELLKSGGPGSTFRLTAAGWDRIAPRPSGTPGTTFVAMSFSEDLLPAYEAIHAAIEECGFSPIRVDKQYFVDKISDYILAEIRRAQFIVADVTLDRPNVFFEAGFAIGLGKEVIWTRRTCETPLHFDTSQYQHIQWNDEDDLKTKLTNRLRARFPRRN
jgi:hypothetical protein